MGGYQVSEKWLLDQRGTVLMAKDVADYQRVLITLLATIDVSSQVAKLIPFWPIH